MNFIQIALMLCMLIEIWHLFFFDTLFEEIKKVHKKVCWALSFQKMYNSYMEFSKEYTDNKELQKTIGYITPVLQQIIEQIRNLGGLSGTINKILKSIPLGKLILYLFSLIIEMVYILLFIILMLASPYTYSNCLNIACGCFTVIIAMTILQCIFNKDSRILYITDSIICIGVYMYLYRLLPA